jgi:hypothetical protein
VAQSGEWGPHLPENRLEKDYFLVFFQYLKRNWKKVIQMKNIKNWLFLAV